MTGAQGFIGQRVLTVLHDRGHEAVAVDLDQSILSPHFTERDWDVDAAIHLAAHKYAGAGEEHPAEVADLNIRGTENVVAAVPRVVLASTCKAAAPITVYGATKFAAERIVLNAGGTVVRLVNVLGSTGSVLDIWSQLARDEPLPVTATQRMYMTAAHAARLLVAALDFEPGRYCPADRKLVSTVELAESAHPGRPIRMIGVRRGDRLVERLTNDHEDVVPSGYDGVDRIYDYWEPERLTTETEGAVA